MKKREEITFKPVDIILFWKGNHAKILSYKLIPKRLGRECIDHNRLSLFKSIYGICENSQTYRERSNHAPNRHENTKMEKGVRRDSEVMRKHQQYPENTFDMDYRTHNGEATVSHSLQKRMKMKFSDALLKIPVLGDAIVFLAFAVSFFKDR